MTSVDEHGEEVRWEQLLEDTAIPLHTEQVPICHQDKGTLLQQVMIVLDRS